MTTTVRKKTLAASKEDLAINLHKFAFLLEKEKEKEAATELRQIADDLTVSSATQTEIKQLLESLLEAYSGDHELDAYTIRREISAGSWSSSEELYLVSVQVLNLTKRILKSV